MAPENTPEGARFASPFSTDPFAATTFVPPVVEDEETETDTEPQDVAQSGAAFGLVFQAPDPQPRLPKRAERPARASEPQDEPDEAMAESTDGAAESEDDEELTPRRRRRGGRGRRAKSDDDAGDESSDEAPRSKQAGTRAQDSRADEVETAADGGEPEQESGDHSDESEAGSRKRTRRRRRSGAAGSDNDEPNTVTKVREPRRAKDEVTSIKGSTRLEAKKQRRREGREAGRRRTVVTEAEFLARRESVERVMVVREQEGRTQIAVLEDGVLAEHYVSRHEQAASMAGNVYLGRVQNVLPSMEAAFIDIGRGRNAVLYAGEVNWDAAGLDNQPKRIEHALKAGESVLVQVTKDPIGHKGARLTSQISLPGRFLVYVPGNSMTGISRKLPDTERARLKKILKEVVPADAGVIVRTAAEGASEQELRADVERLTAMWEKIQKKAEKGTNAPVLLHGEPDLTVRVIRDVFNEDFAKMIVSGDQAWDEVHGYISDVAPDLAERLQQWDGERDVFAKYRIDEQLAKAMDRKVWLPSGGSLVIDRTEAMTVVDVNTGKFIGSGGNLEETVTKNNIEAAEEIVRQLRLRDIGGIIVVDFIDMVLESNRDLVVRRLLECLGRDRTKHQVAEVTSLGLVQMTRKRVGTGLVEVFSEQCEACHGRGIIIHDHPVENRDINGQDTNRRGRGRRGGRDQGGSATTPQRTENAPSEQSEPKDNRFAQMAAAAHAAAVAKDEVPAVATEPAVEATSTDGADTSRTQPTVTGRVRRGDRRSRPEAHEDAPVVPVTTSVPDETPAPRRRSRRAAASSGAPTVAGQAQVMTVPATPAADASDDAAQSVTAAPDVSAAAPQPVASPEIASVARKRSRRAASSAGAPVALQPVDLTAPVAPTSAPLTTVAGADTPGSEPASRQAGSSSTPTKRTKRVRVVSAAGAPGSRTPQNTPTEG